MQLFDYYILVCEYFECSGKHNAESNSVRWDVLLAARSLFVVSTTTCSVCAPRRGGE